MERTTTKPVNILLAEDDQIDAKAFLRAMDKAHIRNPVTVARDGVEAWELLKGLHDGEPFPRPNLVILDINMPRMSGIELLRKIRADDMLRNLIVFVMTTSTDDNDKVDAYDLNVAGYMIKSDVGNSFFRAVELVDRYRRVVEFPDVPALNAARETPEPVM